MASNPETFKARGNEFFKAGNMSAAVTWFSKAAVADPSNPVYPSNLSAALYEAGNYALCIERILSAWRLSQSEVQAKPDLVLRLSSRLARALAHGFHSGTVTRVFVDDNASEIRRLREVATKSTSTSTNNPAANEHMRVWKEWDDLDPAIGDARERQAALRRLAQMPMFMKSMDPTLEFHYHGHDEPRDLLAGWGQSDPYPLELNKLPASRLSKIAFMFGGVGDGRHAYATLSGLSHAAKTLPKGKVADLRVHLTLLDIHAATIARDLCVLMLVQELINTTESTARAEIKATLMYTFTGILMPSYCRARLMDVINDLRKRLSETPPDLPGWLYVVSETVPVVLSTLDYWMTLEKSTRTVLDRHLPHGSSPDAPSADDFVRFASGGNPDFWAAYKKRKEEQRQEIRDMFLNAPEDLLRQAGFIPDGLPTRKARNYIEENIEMLVDSYQKIFKNGTVQAMEELWYQYAKVLLPPKAFFSRHPGLEVAWKHQLDIEPKDEDRKPSKFSKFGKEVVETWYPNVTIFDTNVDDPDIFPDGDGYPVLSVDVFPLIAHIEHFNRRYGPNADKPFKCNSDMLAFEEVDKFFTGVADTIRMLGDHITVELICGGLSEELVKMSAKGDVTRPESFPRQYTRMWLSNVPDYTHGPMNMLLCVVPQLQPEPEGAIACNCLLNTPAWNGDEGFISTYTLLPSEDIPKYFGCKVVRKDVVMQLLVLSALPHPRPLAELASRDELTTWLTRVLFSTFFPGKSKIRPYHIHMPHNLVAFVHLLVHLHSVGYPGHWLSEFLARVLSGAMFSDVAPYAGMLPIPLAEHARRVQRRRVRTDPWLVELENIIGTAHRGFPFPVALPCVPDDICVWETPVEQGNAWFSRDPRPGRSDQCDPATHLLFYRSAETSARSVIEGLGAIFEGRTTPPPGSFFVLTAQEYVHYRRSIRFRLSRKRVERMREEKWSVVAYRYDTGEQGTRPAPIAKWACVQDESKLEA